METHLLSITSYNCRGVMSAVAYLTDLMITCDIICLHEHHLFVEHSSFLTTIDAKFTGVVKVCHENTECSTIGRRKGGLAILWRKSLGICISNMELPFESDRIVAIRIDLPNREPLFVINVYLPSTNMTIAYYRECISELQIINDWLSPNGTIIFSGNLNGQLGPQHSPSAV